MKKILSVLVFTLVAACLVAPKFIAPKHQKEVAELVSNINKAPGYTANIVSTDLAWFGSENKVLVTFDTMQIDPTIQEGVLEAELIIDTHYGPLLFASQGLFGLYDTEIRYTGEKQRNFIDWNEDQPLYELSVLGGFTGNFKIADSIPAFSNPANTFQFSGYTGQGEMTDQGFIYQGTLDQIDVVDGYTPVKAEGFTLSIELNANLATIMQGGFYDSTTDFNLEKLNIGADTELSGLNIEMGSNLDKETQLGSIEIGYLIKDAMFGEFKATDLSLATELTKLSNKFFIDYKNFSDNLLAEAHSPDAVYEVLLAFMQDNLGELLAAKPEFNITDFSGTFPEGSFNATLTSKFADIDTPTIEELSLPEFWLYNAIVTANLEADEPLVRSLAEQFIASKMRAPLNAPEVKQQALMIIDSFVQQGLIKLEDDKYKSEIMIENGQGKIYDSVFPLM
ncbi:YdgA family protein [Marinomonas sp.]|uniref:YdgA family protein n=1 Tax=Marinomonas sp. TaxID=1904862 RepID=UPI003A95D6AD